MYLFKKLLIAIAIFGMATTAMAATVKVEGGVTVDNVANNESSAVAGVSVVLLDKAVGAECGVLAMNKLQSDVADERQYAGQCLASLKLGNLNLGLGGVYLDHTDAFNSERLNGALRVGFDLNDHFSLNAYHWTDGDNFDLRDGRSFVTLSYKF